MSNLGDEQSKLVSFKRITDGVWGQSPATGDYEGLRTKPPAERRFFVTF